MSTRSEIEILGVPPIGGSDFVAQVTTYQGAMSLRVFAQGFLEMAEIACERAVRNACAVDAVVPAMLFTFRHSFELFVKFVVRDLDLVDQASKKEADLLGKHDVLAILKEYREKLALALESEQNARLSRCEWQADLDRWARALHEVDPDGQSIRYPANRGQKANRDGGYAVSMKHLASCLAKVRLLYDKYLQRAC